MRQPCQVVDGEVGLGHHAPVVSAILRHIHPMSRRFAAKFCRHREHTGVHRMRPDRFDVFARKQLGEFPAHAVVGGAINRVARRHVPGMRLKGVGDNGADFLVWHLIHEQAHLVDVIYPWFGEDDVIHVGSAETLPETPASRSRFARWQRIDRLMQPLQYSLLHSQWILLTMDHDARVHAHSPVARPIHQAGRAERAPLIQCGLDALPRRLGLLFLYLRRGNASGTAQFLGHRRHEQHLHGAGRRVFPQRRFGVSLDPRHHPGVAQGEQFKIPRGHRAVQRVQLLRAAHQRVLQRLGRHPAFGRFRIRDLHAGQGIFQDFEPLGRDVARRAAPATVGQ